MTKKTLPMIAGAAALLAGSSTIALAEPTTQTQVAQTLPRGATVIERPRPELEPLGVRAGGFLIYPLVEAGLIYDDNVFVTETNEDSDFIFQIRPQVTAQSDFTRHLLRLRVGADIGRYFDYSSENYEDYYIDGLGRYDIVPGFSSVSLGLAHRKDHEGRGDPDTPGAAAEPVEYTTTGGTAAYEQRFNRVIARIGGAAQYLDFDNVAAVGGGVIDQQGRDRWEYNGSVRLGYDIQPGYQAFVRGTYDIVEYEQGINNRDSQGFEIVGGARLDLTGLVAGEVFLGYLRRDYDAQQFSDFSGLAYGVNLDWSVTQLTTVRALVSRTVEETTVGGASSIDRTIIGLGVDHELLRSLILNARAQYRIEDFQGIARDDDYYTASIGATYNLNRNLYVEGSYTFETRESNVIGADYDSNIFLIRLGAQL